MIDGLELGRGEGMMEIVGVELSVLLGSELGTLVGIGDEDGVAVGTAEGKMLMEGSELATTEGESLGIVLGAA